MTWLVSTEGDNSCLVLDSQWCHNSTTQHYHIGGQVNNKVILGVPGLTLVKVTTTWSALNLPRLFSVPRESTPNGTNVTNQLFLESLLCGIVTSEHLFQISSFNFFHVSCWKASAVKTQKTFSAWRIVTPAGIRVMTCFETVFLYQWNYDI